MENVLNAINGQFVSIASEEKKRNNVILQKVIEIIINELKNDKLFKALYQRNFFGGSFYDGLKVGSSDEFDIDLLFVLPESSETKVECCAKKPGFINLKIGKMENMGEKYEGLASLCDLRSLMISGKKTLSWMQSLVTKSLNNLLKNDEHLTEIKINGEKYKVKVKPRTSGPASTLKIIAKTVSNNNEIIMDVDLVPCFLFTKNNWPSKNHGYRQLSKGQKETFFAVPKLPKDEPKPDFFFRLSFQEQERDLISGEELRNLKPTIRLLKKLRDTWKHPISSYFIKTVFLWTVIKEKKEFWGKPLYEVYIEMLRVYEKYLKNGNIPYFWNEKFNLISHLNRETTLFGIGNMITNVLKDIERLKNEDPFIIAKHLVSPDELKNLREEVDLGKPKKNDASPSANLMNNSNKTSIIEEFNNPNFKKKIEDIVGNILRDHQVTRGVNDTKVIETLMNKLVVSEVQKHLLEQRCNDLEKKMQLK